jgi:uncharacterized membrane protein
MREAAPVKTSVALVHIVFATIWLGSAFFYSVLLVPKVRTLPAAERGPLLRSVGAPMTPLLALSALATVASGLVMMVQLHHLHPGSFSHTRWGTALIVGALASVGALAVAVVVEAPARRRGARLDAAGESAVAGRLGRRGRAARLVALALLFVALATMAVARYS